MSLDYQERYPAFSSLVGKTATQVDRGDYSIAFAFSDGTKYELTHEQDCCEHVYIESVVGALDDLVGEPLLVAEEVTNADEPAPKSDYEPESYTWTFFKLATRKGYVDIRFFGESNGYYGESAKLIRTT